MNTFRNSLKTQSLIGLKNSLTDGSYYVFIGKTTEWPDSTPSEVINTVSEDSEIKRNLISAYKITGDDVRLVVEKNSWESGKIYSQYTDKENTDSKNYYVSTTSNDASGTTLIWVCVSNNNESQTIDSPSATSNVNPDSGEVVYSIGSQSVTSDGYIWELIFQTVGVEDTDLYIPIDYTTTNNDTKILAINVIGNKSFDWAVNTSYSSEYTVSSIDTTQSPDQLYLSKSGLSSSDINNTTGYYANWFLILKNPNTGLIANISKISTSEYTTGSGFKITTCDNTLENSGINYTGYIYSILPGLKTNYDLVTMYPVLDETTKAITSVEILNSVSSCTNNTVLAWGAGTDFKSIVGRSLTSPNFNQSILPNDISNFCVTAISAGWGWNMVLRSNGTVNAWGNNDHGQCRGTDSSGNMIRTQTGAWNYDSNSGYYNGSLPIVINGQTLTGVSKIAAGGHHGVALKNGGIIVWGNDWPYNFMSVPVNAQSGVTDMFVGDLHIVFLKGGLLYAWGWNSYGECRGTDGSGNPKKLMSASYSPATSPIKSDGTEPITIDGVNFTGFSAVSASRFWNIALKNGGVIHWGDTSYGLGTVPSSAQSGVTALGVGTWHAMAIKAGKVIAWGRNTSGQCLGTDSNGNPIKTGNLGDGSNTTGVFVKIMGKDLTDVISVTGGDYHSIALKSDGSVVVWGSNSHGQSQVPQNANFGVSAISSGGAHNIALRVTTQQPNEPIEITVQDKDGDVGDYTFDTIVSVRGGLGYSVLDTLKCNLLRITKSISAQGLKVEDKNPETLTIGSPVYIPSTNQIHQFGVIKTEGGDPLTSNSLDKFSACDLLYTTRSSSTTTALDINDYVCQVVDGVITGYGQVISITDQTGQTDKPILTVLTLYKTFSTSNGVLRLLNITDLTTSTLTPSFTIDSITGSQYIKQSGRIIYVENIPGTYITSTTSLDTKVVISL